MKQTFRWKPLIAGLASILCVLLLCFCSGSARSDGWVWVQGRHPAGSGFFRTRADGTEVEFVLPDDGVRLSPRYDETHELLFYIRLNNLRNGLDPVDGIYAYHIPSRTEFRVAHFRSFDSRDYRALMFSDDFSRALVQAGTSWISFRLDIAAAGDGWSVQAVRDLSIPENAACVAASGDGSAVLYAFDPSRRPVAADAANTSEDAGTENIELLTEDGQARIVAVVDAPVRRLLWFGDSLSFLCGHAGRIDRMDLNGRVQRTYEGILCSGLSPNARNVLVRRPIDDDNPLAGESYHRLNLDTGLSNPFDPYYNSDYQVAMVWTSNNSALVELQNFFAEFERDIFYFPVDRRGEAVRAPDFYHESFEGSVWPDTITGCYDCILPPSEPAGTPNGTAYILGGEGDGTGIYAVAGDGSGAHLVAGTGPLDYFPGRDDGNACLYFLRRSGSGNAGEEAPPALMRLRDGTELPETVHRFESPLVFPGSWLEYAPDYSSLIYGFDVRESGAMLRRVVQVRIGEAGQKTLYSCRTPEYDLAAMYLPDSRSVLFDEHDAERYQDRLFVCDTLTDEYREVAVLRGGPPMLIRGPNSDAVFLGGGSLSRLDLYSGERETLLTDQWPVDSGTVSPDRSTLAVQSSQIFYLYNVITDQVTALPWVGRNAVMRWLNGHQMLTHVTDRALSPWLIDLHTGGGVSVETLVPNPSQDGSYRLGDGRGD